MELQSRGYIETTDSYTSLIVEKVNRYDSGKYVVEAENPSGKKSATILVKVYGMSPTCFHRESRLKFVVHESNSALLVSIIQTLLDLQDL